MTTIIQSISASQRVFNTAELFELILVKVDMKTLLLAQRVDLHWQGTISESSRLQKRLFFTAANPEDLYLLELVDPDPEGYTLLVRQSAFEDATRDKLGIVGIALANYAQSNSFFARVNPEATQGFQRPNFRLPAIDSNQTSVRPSWMRMFVTQPPNVLCRYPQHIGQLAAAQDTFIAYGTVHVPSKTVTMCGYAMRGKYYWDAVKQSIEASTLSLEA
ncbi:uncharacterized protein RCC_08998 [Ramularia collo-cygni]|uniref:Uncharacterized protein n=1 Tax=Ramularia collo-cygni TaxID=112498 RepID=A0A2D3UZ04_9PEZI|nr:uncharacterized protein RCC_08998 [Ramularia collo-cygni]CZT23287.1 uncharacterized protein RCC_08998 [Ramularia collo-cygni]